MGCARKGSGRHRPLPGDFGHLASCFKRRPKKADGLLAQDIILRHVDNAVHELGGFFLPTLPTGIAVGSTQSSTSHVTLPNECTSRDVWESGGNSFRFQAPKFCNRCRVMHVRNSRGDLETWCLTFTNIETEKKHPKCIYLDKGSWLSGKRDTCNVFSNSPPPFVLWVGKSKKWSLPSCSRRDPSSVFPSLPPGQWEKASPGGPLVMPVDWGPHTSTGNSSHQQPLALPIFGAPPPELTWWTQKETSTQHTGWDPNKDIQPVPRNVSLWLETPVLDVLSFFK